MGYIQANVQNEMELVLVEGADSMRMKDAEKHTVNIKIGGAGENGIRIDEENGTDKTGDSQDSGFQAGA